MAGDAQAAGERRDPRESKASNAFNCRLPSCFTQRTRVGPGQCLVGLRVRNWNGVGLAASSRFSGNCPEAPSFSGNA